MLSSSEVGVGLDPDAMGANEGVSSSPMSVGGEATGETADGADGTVGALSKHSRSIDAHTAMRIVS